MSTYSLKLHNKNAEVVLLVDDKTFASLTESQKRAGIKNYVSEIISVDFEESVPNADRSRLIKTNIPHYVLGDFLYIDCDTIICDDLSSIANFDCELGGVLDCHVKIENHIHKRDFLKREKKLGFHAAKEMQYNINGGLILFKESENAKMLFEKWNELWKFSAYKKHDKHDQPALNEANYQIGGKIQLLPGEWNCQLSNGGLKYLQNAKILHYFSSELVSDSYVPYYLLADKNLQKTIKESGEISDDIKEMIKNAKFQFSDVHLISDQKTVDILMSPLTVTVADLYHSCYPIFRFFEVIVIALRWLAKKITGKHR